MPIPKQRHTSSRRDRRRSHLALKRVFLTKCPHCGASIPPHTICPNCGYYKGRKIIDVLAKLDKKKRREKAKELQEQQQNAQSKKPLSLESLSKK